MSHAQTCPIPHGSRSDRCVTADAAPATCAECGEMPQSACDVCPICGRPLCDVCADMSPHICECRLASEVLPRADAMEADHGHTL